MLSYTLYEMKSNYCICHAKGEVQKMSIIITNRNKMLNKIYRLINFGFLKICVLFPMKIGHFKHLKLEDTKVLYFRIAENLVFTSDKHLPTQTITENQINSKVMKLHLIAFEKWQNQNIYLFILLPYNNYYKLNRVNLHFLFYSSKGESMH